MQLSIGVDCQRIHFGQRPVKRLRRTVPKLQLDMKPAGLWYSCEGNEDGWSDWCRAEDFNVERLQPQLLLELDWSKVLAIRTVEEIDAFHEKYGQIRTPDIPSWQVIDWPRVAEEGWGGIEIAPYQWERRLDGAARWYYSWDCASGCVWEPRAVLKKTVP